MCRAVRFEKFSNKMSEFVLIFHLKHEASAILLSLLIILLNRV